MRPKIYCWLRSLLVLSVFGVAPPTIQAEDILFIGNSFTYVNDLPRMMEAIATSKGKTATTLAVTKGGKGWSYHLAEPATDIALKSKPWSWVVLQDYSLNATRAGNVELFLKNGQAFYDRLAHETPAASILLYETWAYSAKHPLFAARTSTPARLSSPDEMSGEIHKNYAALGARLQTNDSRRVVVVAPVGTAFARCVREHPEINLYAPDFKHPSPAGTYLAALVIYAAAYKDSPLGAAPGRRVDPKEAKLLQEVAESTVTAVSTGK